ncbi:MAG: hypothetical protein ACTSSI_01925 [Candidatus Helarchaeota archaeon]
MSVVKITKKKNLEKLLARITLRLGRKPTQQEVLDYCVELGEEHIEELIQKISPGPILDDEKIDRIVNLRKELAKLEWQKPNSEEFLSEDDADLYY